MMLYEKKKSRAKTNILRFWRRQEICLEVVERSAVRIYVGRGGAEEVTGFPDCLACWVKFAPTRHLDSILAYNIHLMGINFYILK